MKAVFPASYSTLRASALAELISNRYGLGTLKCGLIMRGVSDTYLTESLTSSFILKVYRSSHRNLEHIQAETSLLVALKKAGVSVSYPIQDLTGGYIQQLDAVEGIRYAVLFSFAPGHVENKLSENKLMNVGYEMAKFHNVSSSIKLEGDRWNLNFQTTLFQPLEMLRPAFLNNKNDYLWWQELAKKSCQMLENLNTNSFSTGYCHFDFLPKNFHFQGDSVTFFDFDFLGYGWLVYDIMTFWQHFCLDVHFGRITQEEADTSYQIFISAYKEIRTLQEDELQAVPMLYPGFWLFYMGFHTTHDQFYEFVKPEVLKIRTSFIRPVIEKYL